MIDGDEMALIGVWLELTSDRSLRYLIWLVAWHSEGRGFIRVMDQN